MLNDQVVIVADKAFSHEADFLANSLSSVLGKKPAIQTQRTDKVISLQKKPSLGAESYELHVSPNGVSIIAATSAGIFYGIQSLQTILPAAAFSGKSGAISYLAWDGYRCAPLCLSGVNDGYGPKFSAKIRST